MILKNKELQEIHDTLTKLKKQAQIENKPIVAAQQIKVNFNGQSFQSSGYVYAPYIPLKVKFFDYVDLPKIHNYTPMQQSYLKHIGQ